MMIDAFDRVENIVGKGENAGYPQCFQKVTFSGSLKVGKKEEIRNFTVFAAQFGLV